MRFLFLILLSFPSLSLGYELNFLTNEKDRQEEERRQDRQQRQEVIDYFTRKIPIDYNAVLIPNLYEVERKRHGQDKDSR